MDSRSIINLFHIVFLVPLFLYVGIQKTETVSTVFNILLGLGIVVFLYHSYKAYIRYVTGSSLLWINILHVFYVAPLLFYIGMKKEATPRSAFEILLVLAFAAGGYHLYELAVYTAWKTKTPE
jgi:hypothetical protein